MRRWLISGALVLLLAGCTSYPGGLTKDQWEALSPTEQERLTAERQKQFEAQQRMDMRTPAAQQVPSRK